MNDAYELFTDGKRTPREQIRAMEFRLDTFLRAKEAQPGGSQGRKRNLRKSSESPHTAEEKASSLHIAPRTV